MKYPVFLQALALTFVVLIIGLYIGMTIEQGRLKEINNYYTQSEVSLMDIVALNDLTSSINVSCNTLEKANFNLVNRVYQRAKLLDKYEESNKITPGLKDTHKMYDVLRTYLWINIIKTKQLCNSNYSTIVYLYNYNPKDLTKKAEQNIWSKVLMKVKESREDVLLLPIAVNTNLISLKSLIAKYKISSYPAIIINEKYVLTNLTSANRIEKLL